MGSFPKLTPTTMGFLLVFLREENNTPTPTIATKISSSPSPNSFKRISSNSNNPLLSKAQSTISVCFLLLFTTLLLFTLSTFEPTHPKPLSTPPQTRNNNYNASSNDVVFPSTALQHMGTLYRRGTRAMNDIVVCHVPEYTTHDDFRVFLRLLHRSGLTSKSDVVFIFSVSSSITFARVFREENNSFLSLINLHAQLNSTQWGKPSESSFDAARFMKYPKKGEPLWGKKIRTNYSGSDVELTRASYGSVLSFDANELDPENSLAGFLEQVPLSLRRWACYPMLLGRVKRNFKHVMLVDVKNVIILNDPLGRVRNRSPESVFVYPNSKHGKNSERTQLHHSVNSAILMGGARGIRRVSHAMMVAIVRAAMQHKRKNSVSDSAILSQLVRNEFALRSVHLIVSGESIPEASSLAGSTSLSDCAIIQRGTGNNYYDLNSVVKKQICSSVMDSFVYSDCMHLVKADQ